MGKEKGEYLRFENKIQWNADDADSLRLNKILNLLYVRYCNFNGMMSHNKRNESGGSFRRVFVSVSFALFGVTSFSQHNIRHGDKNYMKYDSLENRYVINSKIPDGRWNAFYQNQLIEECSIIDSGKNGIDILYDFRGRKSTLSNYTNDRLNGYEMYYDSTGFVFSQCYYLDNRLKNVEGFDSNGNLMRMEQYCNSYSIEQNY